MSLRYVVVAKDKSKILAEYANDAANNLSAIQNILPKIQENRRRYYEDEQCRVYTYSTGNIQYICISDKEYKPEAAFRFLAAIQDLVNREYSQEIATALALGAPFKKRMQTLMEEYNQNPESDKAKAIIADLTEVKNATVENLNTILDRNFHMDVILKKSEGMVGISVKYKKTANEYKMAMMRRYMCCTCVMILILIVGLWLLVSFICGFDFSSCRKTTQFHS
eukprot:TRINITY_DN1818_c0_g1_i1.p1 TRINITY_DN1818_c0_g1~~TRINITY_DN1818_c0_g1_i1.p1  ORF type:complete len:223 (+),score=23.14 TRINITY_DN1818_c0_g1_i1:125-793(+)